MSRPPVFSIRCSLFAAVCLACGGCVSTAPVPEAEDVVALPAAFTAAGATERDPKWWRALGSRELNAWVDQALADNRSLAAAAARVDQADAERRRASGQLLPSAGFAAAADRAPDEPRDGHGTWRVEVDYELDVWGRLRAQRDAAAFLRDASEWELHALRLTVAASVANAWVSRTGQEAQIRLLREQMDSAAKGVELLRVRNRRGQANAIDVVQQEQLVESLRGEIEAAIARREVLDNQIAVLRGLPPGKGTPASTTMLPTPGAPPASGLPSDLVLRRPDLAASYARIAAADRELAVAVADLYPRFSIGGTTGGASDDWSGAFGNWSTRVLLAAAGPIFEGGRFRAEVARRDARRRELVESFAAEVLDALREVEDALANDRQQARVVASLESQEALARTALTRARAGYLAGSETYLRVLDAQRSLQGVQRSLLSAKQQWLEYRIALHLALAGSIS